MIDFVESIRLYLLPEKFEEKSKEKKIEKKARRQTIINLRSIN